MEQITIPVILQALVFLGLISNILARWLRKHVSVKRLRPWKNTKRTDAGPKESNVKSTIDSIIATSDQCQHPCAQSLATLIQQDGAGSWPPKTNHFISSWPAALCPYRQIWDELSPLIPAPNTLQLPDDDANRRRIDHFRRLVRENLAMRVDLDRVAEILGKAQSSSCLGQDTVNAFYCCLAMLRDGYRWAIVPAVKVAQLETVLDMPSELDVPWKFLQKRYGLTAESSNLTATLLHNFTNEGKFVFNVNRGMPESLEQCEEHFCRISYDTESLALPIYNEMMQVIVAFDNNDKAATLRRIENIYPQLRHVLRVFYANMHDGRVPKSLWMSHVQSFQAWGLDRVDADTGNTIRENGVSGSHLPLFQAIDSFLGIDRYLPATDLLNFIPARQREFCEALQSRQISKQTSKAGFCKIAERLKVFRAAHKARVMSYLSAPAPERIPMTAGKSALKNGIDSLEDASEPLHRLLVKRHNDTV